MGNVALTVLNNNDALQMGGLGMDSTIFQLKPASVELVQKTTHQENAVPGKFRVTATNEHYDTLHVAFLAPPVEQREMYKKGSTFSSDNKICFSTDFLKPHDKAKEPQAMVCASCPQQSWDKYNQARKAGKTKLEAREYMPSCRAYWHLFLVDRLTKLPYYLNIKGANIEVFKYQMQNWMRTFAMMQANVKAENAVITKANTDAQNAYNALTPEVKATTPSPALQALKPMPSVFDISFKLYVIPPQAGSGDVNFTIGFKEFAPIKEADRAEFGNMFLDYIKRKRSGLVAEEAVETADEVVNAPASATVTAAPAVVIPATDASTAPAPSTPATIEGQVVEGTGKITI